MGRISEAIAFANLTPEELSRYATPSKRPFYFHHIDIPKIDTSNEYWALRKHQMREEDKK